MLDFFKQILIDYPILAPIIFIIARTIPVIIPPIPGLLLDGIGIAIFGWFYGFILAEIGIMIASMFSFYIGRRFREPFLKRFIPIQQIHSFEDKLSEKQKFLGLITLRFVSSPFFDIINYIAGLTKIRYSTYFFATLIVTVPLGFMIYYFGALVINMPFILLSTLIIIIPLIIWGKINKKHENPS